MSDFVDSPKNPPPTGAADRALRRFARFSYHACVAVLLAIAASALGCALAPALWVWHEGSVWSATLPSWSRYLGAGLSLSAAFFTFGFALIVIVPIYKTDEEMKELSAECSRIAAELTRVGVRAKADLRDNLRPGAKFFEWEKKGVPLRLAMGPRDKAEGKIEMKRRVAADPKAKEFVPVSTLTTTLPGLLADIQREMLDRARTFRAQRSFQTDDYADFKARVEGGGFFHMRWCGSAACEAKVKDDTKATIRCIPFEGSPDAGPCVVCGVATEGKRAVFARSY